MSSPECDGIFDTCLSTAAMSGVLAAIILGGAIVMSIPFVICTIQQRKQQRHLQELHREEALEDIQLQLRATQAATEHDIARDDAAGNVDSDGHPWSPIWVREFGPDVDAILPVPASQAHVSPLRRNPVNTEQGPETPKTPSAVTIV